MATSSRLYISNGLYPQEASVATLCRVFTPSTNQFVHNNIISNEVCRVFVLQLQSASHLTYLVSFHWVNCHIKFIQSCKLHIHIFTHPYNHAFTNIFTYSYVHARTTYAQHQFIHGCIGHSESCLVISHQFSPQLFQVVSHRQWTAWIYLLSCFKWSVLNNGQLEFTFRHVSSG